MATNKEAVLQGIAKSGHVPAVSYASVERQQEGEHQFVRFADSVGKKKRESIAADKGTVDDKTQFPASSLSKVVFTYLVLQLVKDKKIDLDEPLHDILPNERFLVDGQYPLKAKQLTARHVLSHTTGLPNLGSGASTLKFSSESELGEGYSYSGEAFLYLQKVLETKTGKTLESLAKEYVFEPLGMERSTFLPPSKDETNVVAVHTELGKAKSIYVGEPSSNAAGSLLTTADDFSKFMVAWLENRDDPTIKQAFEPSSAKAELSMEQSFKPSCGLGWHLYKNKEEVIAYQFGENPNTRAFVAINLTKQKSAAFFTNSENGMSIANQIFTSGDLAPIADMQAIYNHLYYTQSDEPGWQETLAGRVAEAEGNFEKAKEHFEKALAESPEDESKQLRLAWFNNAQAPSKIETTAALALFVGSYTNPYEKVELSVKEGDLICNQSGRESKLVRISKTEFVPEADQDFKLSIDKGKMSLHSIYGYEKSFAKQPLTQAQYKAAFRELKEYCQPSYRHSTESSREKETEKYSPEEDTPKLSWRP